MVSTPKVHKTEGVCKANAVEGVVKTKALTAMDWLFQTYKTEGYHLNIKKTKLLFVIMSTHILNI